MMSNHFDDTHPAMSEVSNGVPSGQPKKTTWPTVVGVIGIILASLNILGSICLIAFASNLFAGLLSETDQANLPLAASSSFSVVTSIIGFVVSIWLLFGSIRLIQRQGSSRGILNTWAIVAIIWAVIATAWSLYEFSQISDEEFGESVAEVDNMSEEQRETAVQLVKLTAGASSICGGVWAIAWPVIVLCFLNGQRRKQEMATWSNTDDQQQFSI
ncbi:MAG: hypothetical protein P8J86_11325 [Phycisphaerales bacterium]|nr:hypothetical protein [Phycisphaerales bacterium]